MRLKISCRWFGIQLLFQRGWSQWHDHDWNAITFFLGRALEQYEADYTYLRQRSRWFVNVVPFHRWHRFKAPLGVMLILHGKKQQDHIEVDDETHEIVRKVVEYTGFIEAYRKQTPEELAS